MNPDSPPPPSSCPVGHGCVPALDEETGALILDFDGTLADTRQSHEDALRTALLPYGIVLDAAWYARHVGLSIGDLLAALPGGRTLPRDEVIARSRAHLLAEVHTITPIACTVKLLRRARAAGLPCAVASGASRQLVGPGLDALGLHGEFAAVVTREDADRGKPAPDLFLTAARRLGIAPRRCLAVDDAPDGIAAARAAGMRMLTMAGAHLAPVSSTPATPRSGAARRAHTPLHDPT
ncbi:HAD family hydrolase [Kitasatospora sp. NPDC056783]|uniref:HAD family hydrolase n=1 Tax=Kitasatospora sp. NPDC056783 TaxID=3345943 RepID=UPI0036D05326